VRNVITLGPSGGLPTNKLPRSGFVQQPREVRYDSPLTSSAIRAPTTPGMSISRPTTRHASSHKHAGREGRHACHAEVRRTNAGARPRTLIKAKPGVRLELVVTPTCPSRPQAAPWSDRQASSRAGATACRLSPCAVWRDGLRVGVIRQGRGRRARPGRSLDAKDDAAPADLQELPGDVVVAIVGDVALAGLVDPPHATREAACPAEALGRRGVVAVHRQGRPRVPLSRPHILWPARPRKPSFRPAFRPNTERTEFP